MADDAFTALWQITAPVAPVWEAIAAVKRWPQWWRGIQAAVPLRRGDAQGVGAGPSPRTLG